jgi:enoyl-CoA hydratase
MESDVIVEVREGVCFATLNRPARRNALGTAMIAQLVELFAEVEDNDAIRAVAVTGVGTAAFCAGVDLKEMDELVRVRGLPPPAPMRGPNRDLFEMILECSKPTLAILNGPAVGGGCELALACDLRIGADHADLKLPEVQRGLAGHFAAVMLPRLLPRAIAMQMLYTGRAMSPHEALGWGLLVEVVPAAELASAAELLLRSIVSNAPLSLLRYKEVATATWSLPISSALRMEVGPNVYRSHDREEGVRAYVEHRAPKWEGR